MLSVLLVDNNPYVCEIFGLILGYHGVPCSAVSGVEDALHFLESHDPSVVVIEILQPDLDGFALLETLKASGLAPGAKFVATSVFRRDEIRTNILDAGFDGFLAQPFDVVSLVPFLRDLLESA